MRVKLRLAALGMALLGISCSKTETGEGSAQARARGVPDASVAVPPVTTIAPRDLDTQALERDLGCEKAVHARACRVLKEFAQAQRFTARTPSGEGRWIGPAIAVEQGVESTNHLVLWCKSVPTSQVGPGDLPVKAGFGLIPAGLRLQSEKLMRSLTRAADPPESNPAFQFAHGFVPKEPGTLASTAGASVHLTAEHSAYLRFSPPRKVYLVSPATTDAASGDGIYAELLLGDW